MALCATRCLNCDEDLHASGGFCPRCGQRTDTARLTVTALARDLMHTFVNVERGPLAFAKALLVRPGGVALEYVQGRRRRHYGPFATLAVLVGVTALAVNLSGFHVLTHDGLTSGAADLLQRHFNLLLLVQLPLLGVACAAVFRPSGHTLPEHMVLVAYALSVRAVFLALVGPLAYLTSSASPRIELVVLFWATWYAYFGWAASQFYPGPRWRSWWRGVLAAALGHAGIMAVLLAGSKAWEWIMSR